VNDQESADLGSVPENPAAAATPNLPTVDETAQSTVPTVTAPAEVIGDSTANPVTADGVAPEASPAVGSLPMTGVALVSVLGLAGALLAAGGLVVAARRRIAAE